jgi:hypothetical protein
MSKVLFLMLLSLILTMSGIVFSEDVNYRSDNSTEVQKKKSHNWLIPVGAGGGFGLGLLIGFNAFDESINSDAKIWTTAAVCAGVGGLLGWLFARHMDKPAHMQLSVQRNPDLIPNHNFICSRHGSILMLQVDCMYPDYLRSDFASGL